jgi:RNA polymerase sigma-70 factor (ECF subfamily)
MQREAVTNERLLEKIHADDPGAFDDLVQKFGDGIYGFGRRMCGEAEDAKDVVQDTLIQAYRSLKDLRNPAALKSWLYRVAANACLMKRRKKKHEPDRELSLDDLAPGDGEVPGTEIPDVTALPDQEAERNEIRRRVRAAIEELPPHYRIVLLLRDMEHFTAREVSEMLGIAETAVKMRLHRARLMVRKRLEAEFADSAEGEVGS